MYLESYSVSCHFRVGKIFEGDKLAPVNTAWRFLRLLLEKRPPVRRVAANVLNKQLRTADKGWSSSLGSFGEVLTTPHSKSVSCYESHTESLGHGLILGYDLSSGKSHEIWYLEWLEPV